MTGHTGLQLHMYDRINASCRSSDFSKGNIFTPMFAFKVISVSYKMRVITVSTCLMYEDVSECV